MRYFIFLCLLSLGAGCAALPHGKETREAEALPFSIAIAFKQQDCKPGEAVLCEVTLRNDSAATQVCVMLDHGTMQFYFYPRTVKGLNEQRVSEPVFSEKEETGKRYSIGAGEEFTRTFVFTQLTFERGPWMLYGVYSMHSGKNPDLMRRAYAKAAAFTVKDEPVAFHRYLNGLITKEEAIRLAGEWTRFKADSSEAKLIVDEAGFDKWWINLRGQDGQGAPVVKSCFINPYLGAFWKEAKPFSKDQPEKILPPNSKVVEQLREKKRNAISAESAKDGTSGAVRKPGMVPPALPSDKSQK
ncbi:MAG: hypothetical protein NTX50_12730 [Candidatus Sumerlaeota bacterium]|nr:hypothetical protein [Candidatus Sumerlaeota bacterium]